MVATTLTPQQASKLETYKAHNKTVEQTHFYRDYEHQESHNTKRTKFTQWYLQFQEQHPSRHPICCLFLSAHAIPEKLAQRLLGTSLSVGQFPFSLLLLLRHWVSLFLFSLLIQDECNNPFATCVYIGPVPCLWVCCVVP